MSSLNPQNCSVRQALVLNMFFKRRKLGSRKVTSWMEWIIDSSIQALLEPAPRWTKTEEQAWQPTEDTALLCLFLFTLSPTSTPEAITSSDSKYMLHQDMAIKGIFARCHSLLMYWWLYCCIYCWLRFTNSFRINILYSIPSCSYKNYQENIIVMVLEAQGLGSFFQVLVE